jgi:NitT/TauT family transport system permease protein
MAERNMSSRIDHAAVAGAVVTMKPSAADACDTARPRSLEERLRAQVLRDVHRGGLIEHAVVATGRALLLIAILGLWAYAAGRWVDEQSVSDPVAVAAALYDLIETGRLWPQLWRTVGEVVSGYAAGAVAAVALAAVFALAPVMERVLRPFLVAVYSIPKIALAPLMVMWFGLGLAPKIILAGAFVFFVVFMNAVAGIASVNRHHVDIIRVMGAGRLAVLRKIVLPTTIPFLVLGLRLAVPEAMTGAVIGEFISANQGLGYLVYSASNELNTAVSLAALVVLVLVVALADMALGLLERLWLPGRGPPADIAHARRMG